MITTFFTLKNYDDWAVWLYVAVDQYYADEILDQLEYIRCPLPKLIEAEQNLRSGLLDTGLTYSNYARRETVMVIALTSSGREFANSLRHETDHLHDHITEALGMSFHGESSAYLAGEIMREAYDFVQPMMCDCCRKHLLEKRRRAA